MLAGNIPGQTQTIPVAIYFAVEAGDMRQALVWVLIILAISLTVLTAVNKQDRGALEQGSIRSFLLLPLSLPTARVPQRGHGVPSSPLL
jgi:molybdate transport system permease protein